MTAVSYLIMATSSSASLLFLAACLQLNSVTTVGCPDTHIIITGYLDISTISTQVSIRSQLSKLVGAGHSGKVTNERPSSGHVTTLLTCDWLQVFSVVGVGQSVVSLLSHSVFGLVYSLTLATQVPSIYTIYSIYNIYNIYYLQYLPYLSADRLPRHRDRQPGGGGRVGGGGAADRLADTRRHRANPGIARAGLVIL